MKVYKIFLEILQKIMPGPELQPGPGRHSLAL